jgi:hypothetical protein
MLDILTNSYTKEDTAGAMIAAFTSVVIIGLKACVNQKYSKRFEQYLHGCVDALITLPFANALNGELKPAVRLGFLATSSFFYYSYWRFLNCK